MFGTKRFLGCVLACGALSAAVPLAANAQLSVEGAWTPSEWTVDGEMRPVQPGIFIFTSTHYSMFYVNQAEDRAQPEPSDDGLTDAQKAAAYDEFTANSGRYTLEGNTLTTRAYLAKSSTYMAAWPDNAVEHTVERDGDTLTITFRNGNSAKLVRREGQAPPG